MAADLNVYMLFFAAGSAVVIAESEGQACQIYAAQPGDSPEIEFVDQIGWDGGPAWLCDHYNRREEIAAETRKAIEREYTLIPKNVVEGAATPLADEDDALIAEGAKRFAKEDTDIAEGNR